MTAKHLGDHFDVDFILEQRLGWTTVELLTNYQQPMSLSQWQQFQADLNKLMAGMPPQYVIGRTTFYGLPFEVNEATLIPRVETAELVDWVLSENQTPTLSVLDIGTGSGAIAVALKANRPEWNVTASDISEDALTVAKRNAITNGAQISFVKSDVFQEITAKFDVIVSNPPYIDVAERDLMDQRVLDYEPQTALFAADNGLAVYNQIVMQLKDHLNPDGHLFLEIGFKQGEIVAEMLQEAFPAAVVEVRRDAAGKPRMVQMKV